MLVAVQVWMGVRNSKVELITGMTTLITQVDQALIDHPHLRAYFKGNVDPPPETETEGQRARAVAMTMANVLDHVVEHRWKMKCRTRKAWLSYIDEVYKESPVFKDVLTENENWWPGLQKQLGIWK
ncbi:MAG TPA: hypothetical protein VLI94_09100 [Solirubrobacterales bacterium]|nr:hypothetical protein [Solirubrobacterales bacterium]